MEDTELTLRGLTDILDWEERVSNLLEALLVVSNKIAFPSPIHMAYVKYVLLCAVQDFFGRKGHVFVEEIVIPVHGLSYTASVRITSGNMADNPVAPIIFLGYRLTVSTHWDPSKGFSAQLNLHKAR